MLFPFIFPSFFLLLFPLLYFSLLIVAFYSSSTPSITLPLSAEYSCDIHLILLGGNIIDSWCCGSWPFFSGIYWNVGSRDGLMDGDPPSSSHMALALI